MSLNKYIISLKPITPYFFGGEQTFGEDNTHYFVRSNYLPQQTTILGFLRYELLLQNNLIGTDPVYKDWASLIGPKSFQCEDGIFTSDFGRIMSISPLFLSDGHEHYITQARDWVLCKMEDPAIKDSSKDTEFVQCMQLSFDASGSIISDTFREKLPVIKAGGLAYNPKYGLKDLWVNSDGTKMRQWDVEKEFSGGQGFGNGFFIQYPKVGIHKNISKTKEDTGDFFRQSFYKLVSDYAFAFYVDLDLSDGLKFGSRLVTMGGERSVFNMTVSIATDSFSTRFDKTVFSKNTKRRLPALVLVSDAFADTSLLSGADFAVLDSVPFRNITTIQKDQGNYTRLGRSRNPGRNDLQKADSLLYLIKRGSVFFADDLGRVKSALSNPSFEKIGYNQFIEL